MSINDPIEGLTETEVSQVMDEILAKGIFVGN
ncbi:DUF2922 domain-containing protein [Natranaerobius trueperi]|uniref:Uncharacterized protein n=1 Tax=Natranaerobius trueperi TaxID=759412 RepID=A0A226BWG9_9FIRM|nr:hypothetical protein CDO51_09750 [Natranaerobius trueperi]